MLTSSGFKVKRGDLKNGMLKELTVRPQVGEGFQGGPFFKVYRENSTRVRLPRFYGQHHYPHFVHDASIQACATVDVPFVGKLKEENQQHVASSTVVDILRTKGGGILSLPTGYGKTTVALHVLSVMSVKTLIIVHKEFLMNQWIDRIKQFLPDARIGIIRQNKVDVAGKDVVIAMLQSLSMKTYEKSVFSGFGMTIIDETHHICSKTFSCALFNVCTRYILGLSATPERKDGLTKVLHWFIGDIAYQVERDTSNMNIIVERHMFNCDTLSMTEVPLSVTGRVSVPEIINILTELDERNEYIVQSIIRFYEEGRKTIILTDRRQHCIALKEMLEEKGVHDAGLYMGGMKKHQLDESEAKKIILATYSLAHEGLDIPTLDTLILATPKTDVVQASGRILRTGGARKFDPYILDIVDAFSVLPRQANQRRLFYKKSKFTIIEKNEEKKKEKKLEGFSFVED
jgi:superfamily II DNA or RNA helicase